MVLYPTNVGSISGFIFIYSLIPGPPTTIPPFSGNRTFEFAEGGCVAVEFTLWPSVEDQKFSFCSFYQIEVPRGTLAAEVAGQCRAFVGELYFLD